MIDALRELPERAREWTEGRNPWIRLPLLLWGLVILFRIVTGQSWFTPIDWLNLGFHELGHVVFSPLGEFMGIAGGSIVQLLVPIGSIVMFLRQPDYFAAAFCLSWLAESLLNLSFYIADGPAQQMPLVSIFGEEPIHDWNYLLSQTGMLNAAPFWSFLSVAAAFVCEAGFLALGGWLLWRMRSR